MIAAQPAISRSALSERQSSQSSARAGVAAASNDAPTRIAERRREIISVPPAHDAPYPDVDNLHGGHFAGNAVQAGDECSVSEVRHTSRRPQMRTSETK